MLDIGIVQDEKSDIIVQLYVLAGRRRAFLLWRTDEGYPAPACPRQLIDDSFSGANTLSTAVWVPVVINGLSDIVCM